MNRRRFLSVAGALIVPACGGGGGGGPSASGAIIPAPAIRKDLGYGYYFGQNGFVDEVANHTNLWWAAHNLQPIQQMAGLTQAKGKFRDVVLDLPAYPDLPGYAEPGDPETEIRKFLERLARVGLLAGVTHLYPMDEPERFGLSDIDVGRRNDLVRKIALDYPDIASAKLGVFYSVGGARPGITTYDRVGLSAYDYGNRQGSMLDALESRTTAKWWVIPYGNVPWSLDPAGLMSYAHRNTRVAAVIPFTWQTVGQDPTALGIREQVSIRALYVDAGRAILA